jgi:hypothetical protein
MILPLLFSQQVGHWFGGNLQCVQIVFQNAPYWPKWNLQDVSNFTDSDSSVFKDQIFIWPTFSYVYLVSICAEHWTSSPEVTLLLTGETY